MHRPTLLLGAALAALAVSPPPALAQGAPTAQNSTEPGSGSAARPAPAPDGFSWGRDRLTLSLADGNFTLSPLVRLDVDRAMFFDQNRPGGFETATNVRRGRLGVRGTFLRDFEYNLTWDLGGFPSRRDVLYEAQIGWNFAAWGTLRVGAFTPQHMPEYAGSSFDLPFMERAAITNIVASLATGDSREAVGLEARGDRWAASLYVTAGSTATLQSDRQRGLAGRAVVVALDRPGAQIQLGLDAVSQFAPGTGPGPDTLRLRDYPELRGGNSRRFLDTAGIATDTATAFGPEVSGRLGPVYVEAVYQHIDIDVTGGGSRSFDGWYAQAAVPLLGPPRSRNRLTATWNRPKTEGWINPAAGNWGAMEATARFSTAELRDGRTRGGRQSTWTLGVNWYLSPNLRLQGQYENGRIDLDRQNRDFQSFGVRASLSL